MPSISVHAHTLPELGLQALQHAIQANRWPVEVTVFSRFRQTTRLFAIFSTCHTTHHLPLQPLPFHPHTHRLILTLPPGIHHYLVVRAQSVIASGTLHVVPLQFPPTVTHPVPSHVHNALAKPLRHAVAFTFSDRIPRMSAVHLEIASSNHHSIPMLRRGHTFTKQLPLSPGHHRYRFRVLFQPPLRRLTDIPLIRVGWSFSDSFRWGVVTQWMAVHVVTHPPATPSNPAVSTNHATDDAVDLHNIPPTTASAPSCNQLETLQPATSCDDESSSDKSDVPMFIDTTLDGYSSEVSTSEASDTLDDIQRFAIFSSTSDESTTSSSHSVSQSLSNDPFPTQLCFRPSNTVASSDSSSLEARIHEHSSSTASLASTRDLPTAGATLLNSLVERNSEEYILDALQTTPDVSDVIWFSEISPSQANTTLRHTSKSPRGSYDVWKFAAKNAGNRERFGTQSWTKGIAIVSLKAMLKGAMMAVADSMMSRTKAKPD